MIVVSIAKAERKSSPYEDRNHNRPKAYVARLVPGLRGTVDREFIKRLKDNNRLLFSVAQAPGDIYEIRNWWWDSAREAFTGGTTYIGFDDALKPTVLTREEAFNNVLSPAVRRPASELPAIIRAEREIPPGIVI